MSQELDNALLAILGDFKIGDITFTQALEEIKQAFDFHNKKVFRPFTDNPMTKP